MAVDVQQRGVKRTCQYVPLPPRLPPARAYAQTCTHLRILVDGSNLCVIPLSLGGQQRGHCLPDAAGAALQRETEHGVGAW